MHTELDRLRRMCDALVDAFEAHPETRRADRCLISLDNGEGATVEDRDERPSALAVQPARSEDVLWTARRVADHYAVMRDFIYAHANESAGSDSVRGRACASIPQPCKTAGGMSTNRRRSPDNVAGTPPSGASACRQSIWSRSSATLDRLGERAPNGLRSSLGQAATS
jgi:hypothetical protein